MLPLREVAGIVTEDARQWLEMAGDITMWRYSRWWWWPELVGGFFVVAVDGGRMLCGNENYFQNDGKTPFECYVAFAKT